VEVVVELLLQQLPFLQHLILQDLVVPVEQV
jgi:hypothetical protein